MESKKDYLTISGKIKHSLAEALALLLNEKILPENIHLEHPADGQHGDYATNLVLILWKKEAEKIKQFGFFSPLDLAKALAVHIKLPQIEKIETAPPGFINFRLSKDYFLQQLDKINANKGDNYRTIGQKTQNIMVEYAHPNTHKLFHIGHLRNICLGESICRILEYVGNTVHRTNYQGDVGMHIAKCLWAILKTENYTDKIKTLSSLEEKIEFLGKCYTIGNTAYENDVKAREEINKTNGLIYTKDSTVFDLWQETRRWSLDYFERIYKQLYTTYDRLYFESEVWESGRKIVLEFLKRGVFEESEGAIIFDGEKYGFHKRVFINSRGWPTYEAKDMGLAQLQHSDWHADRYIHVVGPEQKGYFEVVFKALEFVQPELKGKEYHRAYGWVRLKEGKMSSRAGNVVTGESLLTEAKAHLTHSFKFDGTDQEKEITLEQVAVGAVKYSMLKYAPETEFAFDMKESISLEGNSGPYLQYTYARCQSVLKKQEDNDLGKIKIEVEPNEAELKILRTLPRFSEAASDAAANLAPNIIANYLYGLAQNFNLFYNEYPILQADKNSRIFRLQLTSAVSRILITGLQLLGIQSPEKM